MTLPAIVLGLSLMSGMADDPVLPQPWTAQEATDPAQAPEAEVAPQTIEELLIELERASGETLKKSQAKSFARFTQEVEAYNGWNAQRIAEGMHRRAEASWSAMTLALVSTRLGDSERATRVLRDAIEVETNPVTQYELYERLGLAHMGAGREMQARGPLGSAFRRGSVNAGVVLGRIELRDGRMPQARAIFRTLLDKEPPASWALRGWGLSMLPPPESTQNPH
jgi:hypothetical protein